MQLLSLVNLLTEIRFVASLGTYRILDRVKVHVGVFTVPDHICLIRRAWHKPTTTVTGPLYGECSNKAEKLGVT